MARKSDMYRRVNEKQAEKRRKESIVWFVSVGMLFLVGLPAAVTIGVPVSSIRLERVGENVSLRVKTHVFLVVPFRTRTLAKVDRVSTTYTEGYLVRDENRPGEMVRTENQAGLVFEGPDGRVEVPVSPVNVYEFEKDVKAYLAESSPEPLRFWTVANWKIGVIAGGILSLLTLLYLFVATTAAIDAVVKRFKRASTSPV